MSLAVRDLWQVERYIARKRSAAGYHFDFSGRSARRYGRGDFGTRYRGEFSGRAVKRDAAGAGQVRSQNRPGRSHLAGVWLCFDEWPTDKQKTVPEMPGQRWYLPIELVPLTVVP